MLRFVTPCLCHSNIQKECAPQRKHHRLVRHSASSSKSIDRTPALWLSFQATQILNDLAELLRNCNLATCLQTSMVVCSGCCPTHTATAKALSLVSSLVDLSCSTHLQQGEDIDHALYKHTQAIQRVKLAINQSLQYPSRSPSSGFLDGLRILIFQVQIFQLARGWEAVIHRG